MLAFLGFVCLAFAMLAVVMAAIGILVFIFDKHPAWGIACYIAVFVLTFALAMTAVYAQ